MPKPIPAVQPIENKLSTKLDALNWSRVSNTTGQSIAELYFRKFGNNAEKLLREHAELPPEPDDIESFTSMKARTGDMTSQAAKQHSLMLWTSEKELFDKQKQRRDNEIERRSNMISIMEENCQGPIKPSGMMPAPKRESSTATFTQFGWSGASACVLAAKPPGRQSRRT